MVATQRKEAGPLSYTATTDIGLSGGFLQAVMNMALCTHEKDHIASSQPAKYAHTPYKYT